jgi:glycosyltransferase 2 family protein
MTSAHETWRFRRSKTLWLRDFLLVIGLGVFAGLSWQIGFQEILVYLQRLGWRFVLVFLPYLLVFVCDTFGWRYAFTEPPPLSFLRLLALQIIGKAANIITPLAPVGGDPVKAYLLQTVGVPFSAGLASLVVSRTIATVAQGIFVLVITVVTFSSLGLPWQLVKAVAAVLVIGAALVGVFLFAQTHGLFTVLLGMARRLQHGLSLLEEGARDLDRRIAGFYRQRWGRCVPSLTFHLLGWFVEGVEVYVLRKLLQLSPTAAVAIGIAALSSAVRAASFVIPASLGIQEGGGTPPSSAASAFPPMPQWRSVSCAGCENWAGRRSAFCSSVGLTWNGRCGAPQRAQHSPDIVVDTRREESRSFMLNIRGVTVGRCAAVAVGSYTVVNANGPCWGEVKGRWLYAG